MKCGDEDKPPNAVRAKRKNMSESDTEKSDDEELRNPGQITVVEHFEENVLFIPPTVIRNEEDELSDEEDERDELLERLSESSVNSDDQNAAAEAESVYIFSQNLEAEKVLNQGESSISIDETLEEELNRPNCGFQNRKDDCPHAYILVSDLLRIFAKFVWIFVKYGWIFC